MQKLKTDFSSIVNISSTDDSNTFNLIWLDSGHGDQVPDSKDEGEDDHMDEGMYCRDLPFKTNAITVMLSNYTL